MDCSGATWAEMTKCQTAHVQIEESAVGILRTLNLNQAQKLLDLMNKWAEKLTA